MAGSLKGSKSQENLKEAFAGESQANQIRSLVGRHKPCDDCSCLLAPRP